MIINSQLYIYGYGLFLLFLFTYPKINKNVVYNRRKRRVITSTLFLGIVMNYGFAFNKGDFIGLLYLDEGLIFISIFYWLFTIYLFVFTYHPKELR